MVGDNPDVGNKTFADYEKVCQMLFGIQDEVANKRINHAPPNCLKETALVFDSYNLGLITAMEIIGNAVREITIQHTPKG